ncbi:unnamed protein product, partial [Callosobruchus maculatus]
ADDADPAQPGVARDSRFSLLPRSCDALFALIAIAWDRKLTIFSVVGGERNRRWREGRVVYNG